MLAGWIPPPSMLPSGHPATSGHGRSTSMATKSSTSSPTRLSRATSTSAVNSLVPNAENSDHPMLSPLGRNAYNDDEGSLSTIPDPRSRTMSPADGSSPPSPSPQPDMQDEIATLSSKLISAINYQTNLDDILNKTRQELSSSKDRIRQLEQEAADHALKIKSGDLVASSIVQAEKKKLLSSLAEEKKQRGTLEKEKEGMERELENLTQALFEEANKLVVTAKQEAQKEHDILQRRNDQLKNQLSDMDTLLKSHQEQLAELKQVMEQMREHDDQTNPTSPSSPGAARPDSKLDDAPDALHAAAATGFTPSYPTSFTHLLHPVLRSDVAAYDDFASLLRTAKLFSPGSRVSSGSYNGVGLGLGLGGNMGNSPSITGVVQSHPNGSSSSLSTPAHASSHPVTPTTPMSTASVGSVGEPGSVLPLKETRFYKRSLAEDIEPTLRLDIAPGLSWLARRSVLNAMCDGNLVVEPMPSPISKVQRGYAYACSLCGENRKDKDHERTHRFRTSESDSAQRYPLCGFCLGRVRSTCDFLTFLRMIKDGHWRTDDEESEKAAWEESVRLREQMFWCRMGGGVVPVGAGLSINGESKSPRSSQESDAMKVLKGEVERTGEIRPRDITPVPDTAIVNGDNGSQAENDVFVEKPKVGKLVSAEDTAKGLRAAAQDEVADPGMEQREAKTETKRDSSQSLTPSEKEEKRLSITIPRAF